MSGGMVDHGEEIDYEVDPDLWIASSRLGDIMAGAVIAIVALLVLRIAGPIVIGWMT